MITRSRPFMILFTLIVLLSVSLPAQAQSSQAEANKANAVRIIEAFANPAALAEIEPLVAEDFTAAYPTGDVGWDVIKTALVTFYEVMPDLKFTPLMMVADGNQVAVRYEFSGTFTMPLNLDGTEIPPTGKLVQIQSNAIMTFNDAGLFSNFIEVFDNLNFMSQLGFFPADPAVVAPIEPVDPAVWTIAETTPDFTAALRERLITATLAAYQAGDVDALDTLYASDYIVYPTMARLDSVKAEITMLHQAISSLEVEIVMALAEGNWVAYHWRAAGVFTGEATFAGMNISPTNQPISYDGIVLGYANSDGLIVAEWNEVDNLSLAMQMGLIPQ